MNVLHLIVKFNIAGAEKMLLNLVKNLDKKKFNLIICCFKNIGSLEEELLKTGLKVRTLGVNPTRNIDVFRLRLIFRLIRLIKAEKIDLIHTHMFDANVWGRIAAILARVPIIVSSEYSVGIRKKKRHILAERILSIFTHKIVAISYAVKDFIVDKVGINPDKITIIYNGVDLDEYAPPKVNLISKPNGQDASSIGIIARLVPQKGHTIFLEAARKIIEKYENVKFFIVGDGDLQEELKNFAKELGIFDKIIFTGIVKDMPAILPMLDMVILPSLYEAFGLALVEAMAMEKPIVATDVDGIKEIIINEQTGLLIPTGNPDALAKAILRLLNEKEFAQRLAKAGRKRAEQEFNIQKTAQNIEGLYCGLSRATI